MAPSPPPVATTSISSSVGYFWHFPHAQLYSEPERLATAGLLALDTEDRGRRRKTYSLTTEGRSAVREWLASPTPEHFEMRDVAELKLFFNEAGSPDDVGKLAREQIRQHEERIADYEDMVTRHGREEWAEPRMITLELGLEMEHAALRFWTALADDDLDRLRRERTERDTLG